MRRKAPLLVLFSLAFSAGLGGCSDSPGAVSKAPPGNDSASASEPTGDTTAGVDSETSTLDSGASGPGRTDAGEVLTPDTALDAKSDGAPPPTQPAPTQPEPAPTEPEPSDEPAPTEPEPSDDADWREVPPAELPPAPMDDNLPFGAQGAPCFTATDCEPSAFVCRVAVCLDGLCTTEEALEASPCDDGNVCTTDDRCYASLCVAGPAQSCDDDNACTLDQCNRLTGCFQRPLDGSCDDGDACTAIDRCIAGQCRAGATLPCDDGNLCTDDACVPATGCVFTSNTAACDDRDVCTVGDVCRDGLCAASPPQSCAGDGNPCVDPGCDPVFGCVALFNQTPCDDGDACTDGDICVGGQCFSGAEILCPAGGRCQVGGCNAAVGCSLEPRAGPCDDGNRCTVGDSCQGGVCAAGDPVSCDDANPCTLDACSPLSGCTHTPSTGSCDAGVACSDGVCRNGECQASPPRLWSWVEEPAGAYGYLGNMLGVDDGVLAIGTRNQGATSSGRVIKLDPYGTVVWTRILGDGWLYAGVRDGQGYVFAGETPVGGNWQGWLVGTNLDGEVQWSLSFGGAGYDSVASVVPQGDGFTVAGTTMSLGSGRRGWVAHVDREGTIEWQHGFGDVGGYTDFFQVAATADGGALAVGYLNLGSSWYAGLVKVDSSGEVAFEEGHGESGDDGWVGVSERPDGTIGVFGYVTGPDGRYDIAWGETDSAGNLSWRRVWPVAGTGEFPTKVAHYPDGGAAIGASSTANSGDLYAVRIDALGAARFGRLIARPGYDEMYGVASLPDGGLALGGYRAASGVYLTQVYRFSTWGHLTCEEAGVCVDLARTACADGEPCTRDGCDPSTGCVHVDEPDGIECGVESACESAICTEVTP